jgi:hypothetical protein
LRWLEDAKELHTALPWYPLETIQATLVVTNGDRQQAANMLLDESRPDSRPASSPEVERDPPWEEPAEYPPVQPLDVERIRGSLTRSPKAVSQVLALMREAGLDDTVDEISKNIAGVKAWFGLPSHLGLLWPRRITAGFE